MSTWSVDLVGVRELLRQVDTDALELDTEGDGLSAAVASGVEALTSADRGTAASSLSGYFDDRLLIPENLMAFIAAACNAVSAATAAIEDGDATMALDTSAAAMAQYWNMDDAVSNIAGES